MTRVLVIEDEDMVRSTIRLILEKAGFEVEEARNGREGLEQQAKSPVDLVVTDVIMPEKDGVETTIELRAKYPDIGIVAVSGGGRVRNLSFLHHAQTMGADAVLPKPFNSDELLGAVAMALERRVGEAV